MTSRIFNDFARMRPQNKRRLVAIDANFAPPSLVRSEEKPDRRFGGLHSPTVVLRLLNGENLVSGNIVQHLPDPAWPTDFNIFDPLGTAQAKVHPTVTRGRVTYRCRHFIPLLASIFTCNVNLCSDSHAIAFGPYKFQKYPVVPCIGNVAKKLDRSVEHCHHSVYVSIVEYVAKCNAAVSGRKLEIGPSRAAYISELPITQVTEQ
jgi:hypothetical protein